MTDSLKLDYEQLDVYRCAMAFLRFSMRLLPNLPRTETELRSQLRRAAMSIPLNIAEGTGKTSPIDRARFHAIARGSAMECGALVEVCFAAGYVAEPDALEARQLIMRIVSMLTKMCR